MINSLDALTRALQPDAVVAMTANERDPGDERIGSQSTVITTDNEKVTLRWHRKDGVDLVSDLRWSEAEEIVFTQDGFVIAGIAYRVVENTADTATSSATETRATTAVCPKGHENPRFPTFCGECGAALVNSEVVNSPKSASVRTSRGWDKWRAPTIRMGRRCSTLLIALLLAVIAYNFLPIDNIRRKHVTHGEWLWIMLGVLITVRLLLARIDIHLSALTPSTNAVTDMPDMTHAGEDTTKDCVAAFNRCMTSNEFDQLIDTFLDPGSIVMRINESAELGAHNYRTTVERIVVRPPGYKEQNIAVPVLMPRKGELVDNFKLLVDGKPARTLSRRESIGASIAVMTAIFATAFTGKDDPPRALWRILRDQILKSRPGDSVEKDLVQEELKKHFAGDTPAAGVLIAQAGLWKLAMDIFDTDAIIALAPLSGSSVRIEISYTRRRELLILPRDPRPPVPIRSWLWIDIQLQILFGLIRRSDRYELHHSKEAQSYHFRATVPEGLYVYDLVGSWIDDTRGSVSDLFAGLPLRPLRPLWEISDTRGLEHVHAYGRDLDVWCKSRAATRGVQTSERTAAVQFELREKPPGLLFVVVLISVFLGLLVVAAAKWHDLIFVTGAKDKAAPWPVIIFGVPAIISGWMVSRFTPENVRLLSVSTIGVTGWAVMNAAAAVAVSAFSMSVPAHVWLWPAVGYFEPAWSFLYLSCLGCLAMSVMLLFFRVRRYGRRVRGKAGALVRNGKG